MELKEFSDGEMTIALTSVTTDNEVSFYHAKLKMLDSIQFLFSQLKDTYKSIHW